MSHLALPEIERDLLAHCLFDNASFLEAQQTLVASDFALTSHRTIFLAIGDLIESGRPATELTLLQHLKELRQLDEIGGASYLLSLNEGIVRSSSICRDYARRIREKAQLRRLNAILEQARSEGTSPSANLETILAEIEDGLLQIRSQQLSGSDSSVAAAVGPLLERMSLERRRTTDLLGLPTGLSPMDAMTRGYQRGELTVAGARSGVGKSCLMCMAAAANCSKGVPTLLFSLEMSRQQILRRLIACEAQVPFPRIADPRWASDGEMAAVEHASKRIAAWPLQIIDDSGLSIEKLSAIARLAVRRDGVKLIAADYVQIVNASGRDERLRVAAVSRGLTRLAKDEDVPVLVLSQLSRADRSSPNRRPTMGDLRETTQLENDAHVIALLHREWDEESQRLATDGELIIAKQRSGETGSVPVIFNRRSLIFESRATHQEQRALAS